MQHEDNVVIPASIVHGKYELLTCHLCDWPSCPLHSPSALTASWKVSIKGFQLIYWPATGVRNFHPKDQSDWVTRLIKNVNWLDQSAPVNGIIILQSNRTFQTIASFSNHPTQSIYVSCEPYNTMALVERNTFIIIKAEIERKQISLTWLSSWILFRALLKTLYL